MIRSMVSPSTCSTAAASRNGFHSRSDSSASVDKSEDTRSSSPSTGSLRPNLASSCLSPSTVPAPSLPASASAGIWFAMESTCEDATRTYVLSWAISSFMAAIRSFIFSTAAASLGEDLSCTYSLSCASNSSTIFIVTPLLACWAYSFASSSNRRNMQLAMCDRDDGCPLRSNGSVSDTLARPSCSLVCSDTKAVKPRGESGMRPNTFTSAALVPTLMPSTVACGPALSCRTVHA